MIIPLTYSYALLQLAALCLTATVPNHHRIEDLRGTASNSTRSNAISAPSNWPVRCFNPYSSNVHPASVEDCNLIIDEIILRYPNPMAEQSWGYSNSVDIDLRKPENQEWVTGRCKILVKNTHSTKVDRFSPADVALTAHRIMGECIVDNKYPYGGIADIGSIRRSFYVGVEGCTELELANSTFSSSLQVER